jgi:hypothetical protein
MMKKTATLEELINTKTVCRRASKLGRSCVGGGCETCCNLVDECMLKLLHRDYILRSEIEKEYVKAPLDKDGVPFLPGETVYDENGISHIVTLDYSDRFSHTNPDPVQEKIYEDARKSQTTYWECEGTCSDCPSKIDDKQPREYYEVGYCTIAQLLDLLRRQREHDREMQR